MLKVELESIDSPEMYPSTIEEIKAKNKADPGLSMLCEFVAHGWPSDKSQVPTALRHYYPLRNDLTVYHGVLYKSHKVIIPLQLVLCWRNFIKATKAVKVWFLVHEKSCIGLECKLPSCSKVPIVHRVPVMAQHSQKPPVLPHEIPQGPWKFISQDFFKQGGCCYVITVNHYSDWFEVDLLNDDITAANVISVTKAHFTRYGVPNKFLTNNGSQYISQEFKNFARLMISLLITWKKREWKGFT